MTGRHMTVRGDGNSIEHMAFGGPIFYGHAASGFNEKAGHPGNVCWPQALAANKVFKMLDGKQREKALVSQLPAEQSVGFRGDEGGFPGIPVADLTADQKEHVQKTVQKVLRALSQRRPRRSPRVPRRSRADSTSARSPSTPTAIWATTSMWDNWRLEGPSFVWYFRGTPHVHMWINIGADASVKLNA